MQSFVDKINGEDLCGQRVCAEISKPMDGIGPSCSSVQSGIKSEGIVTLIAGL